MKKISIVLVSLLISQLLIAQAGKYSSKYKYLIGKNFDCDNLSKTLKGFTFQQFVETDASKGYFQMASVYKKGNTHLLILHTKENETICNIQDIVELNNLAQNVNIQMGSCKKNNTIDPLIIAVEKNGKYSFAFKVNKDKNRFDKIATKGINCLVEGV